MARHGGNPFRPVDVDSATRHPAGPGRNRLRPRRQRLYWSSEGERATENLDRPALLDTWVRIAGLDGGYRGEFVVPPVLDVSASSPGHAATMGWRAWR